MEALFDLKDIQGAIRRRYKIATLVFFIIFLMKTYGWFIKNI